MVAWIMLLLVLFEGYAPISDGDSPELEKARQSYLAELSLIKVAEAATNEKQDVEVALQWDKKMSQAPQQHYLVTGPNCVYCKPRKDYLLSRGIAFKEISVAEAATLGRKVSSIPFEFDHAPTVESSIVSASVEPSTAVILSILENHLLAQTGVDYTCASLLEFDVDVPDILPSIITQVMTKQRWSNETLTIDWVGSRNISVQPEKITFTPPPSVVVKKGILTFGTSIKQIVVGNSGKSVTIELTTCPDVTVNFK